MNTIIDILDKARKREEKVLISLKNKYVIRLDFEDKVVHMDNIDDDGVIGIWQEKLGRVPFVYIDSKEVSSIIIGGHNELWTFGKVERLAY